MSYARGRHLLAVVALLVLALGYAFAPYHAAAGTPGMVLGNVPTADAPMSATIVVPKDGAAKGYATKVVTISQGGTLSMVNLDNEEHTATADAVGKDGNPLFDRWVEPGHTETIAKASKLAAGTYTFHCTFHPSMTATLIVEGSSGGGVHPQQPHFTLPLRVPPVLTGSRLKIPVEPARVRVFPAGPKTKMWTFGGTYPGPTIERQAGHDTKVTFTNKLPKAAGQVTVHFHGDHHRWQDDGQPTRFLIRHGHSRTYDYPLTDHGKPETEATDFYHDHRMNFTARNNWRGLQGVFLVHSKQEQSLRLPSGKYDVPLMVADRKFTADNQLTDPFKERMRKMGGGITGPAAPPGDGTVGNRILVDGEFAPHLDVDQHRYRLRLLNTSDFTSYDFALSDGKPFVQIGTGSDLLPHPVVRQDILLGPAQRADVIVDFAGELHQKVLLESVPRTNPPPSGVGSPTAALMQFRVTHTARDHTKIPHTLTTPPPIHAPRKVSFTWTFNLAGTATTGTYWTINGKAFDPHRVDVEVPVGATRTWELTNDSPITHYIHLHEEQWHTISRDGKPPPPWERGLEDVWRLDPGESVVIAARFTDYTGVFMIHCHMLDHEDDGMMAQFGVVKPHSHQLPSGYHLRGTARHIRSGGTHMMAMGGGTPILTLRPTAAAGWHRSARRLADIAGVEAMVVLAAAGAARAGRSLRARPRGASLADQ
ncbi:MAG TPA: multicopper oxidase domain-containing protein [Mycobacteriales bacterium]|nr:multicopper oxidase domain-containing protein [Mycobacteriales bacterium]